MLGTLKEKYTLLFGRNLIQILKDEMKKTKTSENIYKNNKDPQTVMKSTFK